MYWLQSLIAAANPETHELHTGTGRCPWKKSVKASRWACARREGTPGIDGVEAESVIVALDAHYSYPHGGGRIPGLSLWQYHQGYGWKPYYRADQAPAGAAFWPALELLEELCHAVGAEMPEAWLKRCL